MSEFALGSYVRKPSGAFWEGVVVGHYGTKQTEDGVAVQLFGWEDGPVQIYPAAALQLCDPAQSRLAPPLPMIKALTDDELIRIQAAIQLEKPGMVVFPTPPPSSHLGGGYIIPRELTDEEWSEVKYNVDRKADPDIPLWRIQEAVKYANHIAGHRGRKMIETPSPQTREVGGA